MEQLAQYIDHTLLKADATLSDIEKLCHEAYEHSFKAVCVNSGYVRQAANFLRASGAGAAADARVLVASVVGFPLGVELSEAKARETELAIAAGAGEIDMVIRIGALKEKNYALAGADIRAVVSAAGGAPVKVILETGLLSHDEIVTACKISEEAGASFVKTATGFLGRGATIDDILLMRASTSLKIKASGGIKNYEQAVAFIQAGATRLGTSSGVALVNRQSAPSGY